VSKSDKRFVKKWRRVRRKGFFHYTLTQGLVFGIIVGGLNLLIMYVDTPLAKIDKQEFLIKGGLIVIGVTLVYALFSWFMNNFIYKKLK
jgi:hypothetical protein